MFRSLRVAFPIVGNGPSTMSAPIAVTSTCSPEELKELKDVTLSISPDAIFSTAVGPAAKKTLARWHVTAPEEVSLQQHPTHVTSALKLTQYLSFSYRW